MRKDKFYLKTKAIFLTIAFIGLQFLFWEVAINYAAGGHGVYVPLIILYGPLIFLGGIFNFLNPVLNQILGFAFLSLIQTIVFYLAHIDLISRKSLKIIFITHWLGVVSLILYQEFFNGFDEKYLQIKIEAASVSLAISAIMWSLVFYKNGDNPKVERVL